jgi:hypothetical protein
MGILSYSGQGHRTQSNIVEQPAFIKQGQKPLKWWAERGLIYCIDPNKPDQKPSYSQPLDALRRVATGIKIFIKDIDQNPQDYLVSRAVLANFFNDFKTKVFDVALEQDAKNGNFIERTRDEYEKSKVEAAKAAQIEAAKFADKKTKIFVSPKSVS